MTHKQSTPSGDSERRDSKPRPQMPPKLKLNPGEIPPKNQGKPQPNDNPPNNNPQN